MYKLYIIILIPFIMNAQIVHIKELLNKNCAIKNRDCTNDIQKIINIYDEIDFGNGEYLITKPIILTKSNQKILGNAKFYIKSKYAFFIKKNIENLKISNLVLINLGSNQFGSDNAVGIYINKKKNIKVNYSLFKNLTLKGFGIGINLQGQNIIIDRCYISDTLEKERIGSGGGHGIYIIGKNNTISNNIIKNMQGGILASTSGEIKNNIIINAFEDNGIYLPKSNNLLVKNNLIKNVKTDGIALNKSNTINIIENQIINAHNGCIRVQESNNSNIIKNRCISENSTNYFIRGFAKKGKLASLNIEIKSNTFIGTLTGKSNPIVFMKADTIYKNIQIEDNVFTDITLSKIRNKHRKMLTINIEKSIKNKKPLNCNLKNNLFFNSEYSSTKLNKLNRGVNSENPNNK